MNKDTAHRRKRITLMCDTCGKKGTLHIITKKVPLVVKDFRVTEDEYGNAIKEPFTRRRLNPSKYRSFVRLMSYMRGGKEQLLDQIVNERPVLYTSSDSYGNSSSDLEIAKIHNETIDLFVDTMLDLLASVAAMRLILRLLVESKMYPASLAYVMMVNIFEGEKIEHELSRSVTDDRWQRSLIEWLVIVRKTEKSSASAAARKYFAYSSDEKRIHLNPRHIEEMEPRVNEFWDRFSNSYGAYFGAQDILLDIICEDQNLYSEYQKSMKHIRNQIGKPWKKRNNYEITHENSKETQTVKYTIYPHFSIRHPYDPQLYAIQKEKYKLNPKANPKPTGRAEHKLHKSKVPRSVIKDLEKEDRR